MDSKGEILIYNTESGNTDVKVLLENESLWLTQRQMGEILIKT